MRYQFYIHPEPETGELSRFTHFIANYGENGEVHVFADADSGWAQKAFDDEGHPIIAYPIFALEEREAEATIGVSTALNMTRDALLCLMNALASNSVDMTIISDRTGDTLARGVSFEVDHFGVIIRAIEDSQYLLAKSKLTIIRQVCEFCKTLYFRLNGPNCHCGIATDSDGSLPEVHEDPVLAIAMNLICEQDELHEEFTRRCREQGLA